jgi:hypothetical protein
MRSFAFALLCACSAPAVFAQTPGDARLHDVFGKAAANQQQLDSRAPSFVCHEEGVSREVHNGKEKRHVTLTGEVTVIRQPDGKLKEHFAVETLDGKPWSKPFNAPLFINDAFANPFNMFSSNQRGCFDFTLHDDHLDFHIRPSASDQPSCKDFNPHMNVSAVLDAEGQIISLDRTFPPAPDDGLVELALVHLGGEDFRITRHISFQRQLKSDTLSTFEGTYTNCHLFRATVTLQGGDTTVDDQGNPLPPNP